MQIPYRGSGTVYFNAKEYRCDLYYSENFGGIVLKINTINENTIGSFLQLPLEIWGSDFGPDIAVQGSWKHPISGLLRSLLCSS